MQATGVEASAISYSILVRACAQALDAASTERWMYAMLTIGVAGDTVSYRTWPRHVLRHLMWPERSMDVGVSCDGEISACEKGSL